MVMATPNATVTMIPGSEDPTSRVMMFFVLLGSILIGVPGCGGIVELGGWELGLPHVRSSASSSAQWTQSVSEWNGHPTTVWKSTGPGTGAWLMLERSCDHNPLFGAEAVGDSGEAGEAWVLNQSYGNPEILKRLGELPMDPDEQASALVMFPEGGVLRLHYSMAATDGRAAPCPIRWISVAESTFLDATSGRLTETIDRTQDASLDRLRSRVGLSGDPSYDLLRLHEIAIDRSRGQSGGSLVSDRVLRDLRAEALRSAIDSQSIDLLCLLGEEHGMFDRSFRTWNNETTIPLRFVERC